MSKEKKEKTKLSKILNYVLNGLTGLLFVLALYIMVFGTIARKNNKLLYIFNYSYSFVETPSMDGIYVDSFPAKSFIITKKTPYEDLNVWDIVVFKDSQDKILIVHRIVSGNVEDGFVTKGDANQGNDTGILTKERYQGLVLTNFQLSIFNSSMISYQGQVLLLLMLVLMVMVIYQVIKIYKMNKKEKMNEIIDEKKVDEDQLRKEILEEIKNNQKKE
ncbi:MAG: signal peptidase I [Acholeplasma sp.]|nr:signal peptidase I [Acholeplasma sp.]